MTETTINVVQEAKVDGRGRPQSLKTQELIQTLREKIEHYERLEAEAKANNQSVEEMKEYAEVIRVIMRAMKGLNSDDDTFLGLIDPKRIEERTRLDDPEAVSHAAMRSAAKQWPIFSFLATLADMEDHYLISGDNETGGLGRREGILLQQAKTKMDGNMILNMPNPSGGVAQSEQPEGQTQQPKKKGILNRILHR
jgi:hypothetical protein